MKTKQFLLKPKKGERLGEQLFKILLTIVIENYHRDFDRFKSTDEMVGNNLLFIEDKDFIKALKEYRKKK